MHWYTLNELVTMRQKELRSTPSPRPSPPPSQPNRSPLEELIAVVMWIVTLVLFIVLVQAILSGQPVDIEGSDFLW